MILGLCIGIVLVALALALREASGAGRGDWLSMPVLAGLVIVLGYVSPAYDVLRQTDLFFLRYPAGVHSLHDTMERALLMALLGTVAFAIGWLWPRRNRPRDIAFAGGAPPSFCSGSCIRSAVSRSSRSASPCSAARAFCSPAWVTAFASPRGSTTSSRRPLSWWSYRWSGTRGC